MAAFESRLMTDRIPEEAAYDSGLRADWSTEDISFRTESRVKTHNSDQSLMSLPCFEVYRVKESLSSSTSL